MEMKFLRKILNFCQGQTIATAVVDKKTGEVYKAAGWKKPAKYVRFDMRDETQRARLYNICDWAGGYLYMR